MRGNAVEKSVLTIHKGRPFMTPFNLITNVIECCEGRLCHDLVINVPMDTLGSAESVDWMFCSSVKDKIARKSVEASILQ